MPMIKLLGGSYREGDKRYTPKSDPFQVSDKMAKILNCQVVTVEQLAPVKKPGKKFGAPPSE